MVDGDHIKSLRKLACEQLFYSGSVKNGLVQLFRCGHFLNSSLSNDAWIYWQDKKNSHQSLRLFSRGISSRFSCRWLQTILLILWSARLLDYLVFGAFFSNSALLRIKRDKEPLKVVHMRFQLFSNNKGVLRQTKTFVKTTNTENRSTIFVSDCRLNWAKSCDTLSNGNKEKFGFRFCLWCDDRQFPIFSVVIRYFDSQYNVFIGVQLQNIKEIYKYL